MDDLKISREEAAELVQLLAYVVANGDLEARQKAGRWTAVLHQHAEG